MRERIPFFLSFRSASKLTDLPPETISIIFKENPCSIPRWYVQNNPHVLASLDAMEEELNKPPFELGINGRKICFVKELNLSGKGINGTNIGPLTNAIRNNAMPFLRKIDLSFNNLSTAIHDFADAIQSYRFLTELVLNNSSIKDEGIAALAAAIDSLPKLKTIVLDKFVVRDDDVTVRMDLKEKPQLTPQLNDIYIKIIAKILSNGALPKLKTILMDKFSIQEDSDEKVLDLNSQKLNDTDVVFIAKVLGNGALPSLTELDLSGNMIGDEGIKALTAVGDGVLPCLNTLHLHTNKITDKGFSFLMPLFEKDGKFSKLTHFSIGGRDDSIGSGVTDKGMKEFADILAMGALPNLEYLSLDNQIGDDGMKKFAAALKKGSGALQSLEELLLTGNKIGDAGMKEFADAVNSDRGVLQSLTGLSFAGNQIGDTGLKVLAAALMTSSKGLPSLTVLNLSNNQIGDTGMKEFATTLVSGRNALPNLTFLSISRNKIGDPGLNAFATAPSIRREALQSLTELDLRDNQIGDKGVNAFQVAVRRYLPNLKSLTLDF